MRRLTDEFENRQPEINLVPMLDVNFAILSFFILSTLSLSRSEGLSVNLPTATQSLMQQQPVRVTVTIDAKGGVFLNKESIAVTALAPRLAKAKQSNANTVVILNADGGVTHDRVVSVLDQIRAVPGLKLAIATKRPLF